MSTPPPMPEVQSNRSRTVLAANMIYLRGLRGWTQETLAFECGLHRTFVAHVERQVRNISLDNIDRIADALGVASCELLTPNFRVPASA